MSSLLIKNAAHSVTCDDQDWVLQNANILIRDRSIACLGSEPPVRPLSGWWTPPGASSIPA